MCIQLFAYNNNNKTKKFGKSKKYGFYCISVCHSIQIGRNMYKLLIVDDELLVQVGIKSMLNWSELGFSVCGTAPNGQAALKIIQEQSPDIVITDIKMPVMDGLELVKICRQRYGTEKPYFIILTGYEDFHMVKQALTYQVSDYLIKLELTPEVIKESIDRIMQKIHQVENPKTENLIAIHPFYDKFFICLLHNLFESEEQFILQSKDLNLDFHYKAYLCCYGEILSSQADFLPKENQLSLFTSSLQMIRELAAKYMPCYSLSLDMKHFALIFCYEDKEDDMEASYPIKIKNIIQHINTTLQNYYNVTLHCGIGSLVDTASAISDSYQYSRQALQGSDPSHLVTFYDECTPLNGASHRAFNISVFKKELSQAFEEYNSEALTKIIASICELFLAHPQYHLQALDAASNILYLSISMLPNGEGIISELFKDSPDGYRSIYRQSSVEQIVNWLTAFGESLSHLFETTRGDYKNHIVRNVKKYINEHISKHLSLNEVAAVFDISPNYLSQLFSKYNDTGFNEYVNICKINKSKQLLEDGNYKVYQIADMLGFESAFYFSKVFKKVEGVSPTKYIQGKLI